MTDAASGALRQTVLMYLLMALYGVFSTIIGTVLTALIAEFGLPLSRGGLFIAVQSFGCFIGIFLSGFVIDRFDKRYLSIINISLLALILVGVYFTSTLQLYLGLVLLGGVAAMLIDVVLNSGIAQLHSLNRGFYMNLLHCSFGIGSFIGPMYAGFFLDRYGSWRLPYLVLGFVCAATMLAYAVLSRGPVASTAMAGSAELKPFCHILIRPVILAWLVIFLYCGHQVGINNWLPTYLRHQLGLDATGAGGGVSAFWLGLIVSRQFCSFLTKKIDEKILIFTGCALAGVSLLIGLASGGENILYVSSAATGLFSGATIP
ncbi:MAG: MFS transporter, partial [Planctomycetes bacterium]|nr:MFS transporter [Planctomycetota bacterium]